MFRLSKEEASAVRDYLLLPYVKRVLELDAAWINHSKMKLPRPYLELINQAFSLASTDLRDAKSVLHRQHITASVQDTKKDIVIYTVYCRGYNQTYRYTSVQIRNLVERRIAGYFLSDQRFKKRQVRSV
ncbi:hypothetical protein [Guptibacillus algicola]|uniref:hypothetical protein n=1 Tax=Guptibacillus algicola TaxID=225844 RepID=UPI001CD7E972|nr:hypothetical protein [Alkalihalobacillus algicola]MCA0986798.1 hypothetical protein [Alkalihalobacillus algicola]